MPLCSYLSSPSTIPLPSAKNNDVNASTSVFSIMMKTVPVIKVTIRQTTDCESPQGSVTNTLNAAGVQPGQVTSLVWETKAILTLVRNVRNEHPPSAAFRWLRVWSAPFSCSEVKVALKNPPPLKLSSSGSSARCFLLQTWPWVCQHGSARNPALPSWTGEDSVCFCLGKFPQQNHYSRLKGVVFLSPRRAIFHLLLDAFLMTCMHIVWNKGPYAPHSFLSLYLSLLCLTLQHKRFRSETNSAQNLTVDALNNEIP